MKLKGHEVSEIARTVIERQVNHLTRLVDDLLDVSRIARGKVQLKKEVLELAEVVAKGIEMASPLLERAVSRRGPSLKSALIRPVNAAPHRGTKAS